ncbi:unnamed protein product [Notodromas monacha]|uniref:Uncharacterized protein n=1 Tax=Notodromas monacha TaxID=399045 RepID=A0A7R9GIW7_9CRUS|nr:unnamed protein product [Notodromas monacha]CAG0922895.1 unnamed protein product [Notodromas monacha]
MAILVKSDQQNFEILELITKEIDTAAGVEKKFRTISVPQEMSWAFKKTSSNNGKHIKRCLQPNKRGAFLYILPPSLRGIVTDTNQRAVIAFPRLLHRAFINIRISDYTLKRNAVHENAIRQEVNHKEELHSQNAEFQEASNLRCFTAGVSRLFQTQGFTLTDR